MTDNLVKMAADILQMSMEETRKNSKPIPEIDSTYFWKPTRGGIAVIINSNGEKLAVGSSISFKAHVQAFRDGKRN
jgi:hypothetical protein